MSSLHHRRARRPRRRLALVALVALVALPVTLTAAPLELRGTRPDFTATVPDGFVRLERGVRPGAMAFARRPLAGRPPVVLTIRPLAGTLENAPVTEDEARRVVREMSPDAVVSLDHVTAMDELVLPVVVARAPATGEVTALANVPTIPRALQVTVSGPAADEPTVRATMRAVLGSVRASTNWLNPRQYARKRAARALLVAGWVLLALYAFAWVARFRRAGTGGPPPWRALRVAWLALAGAALGTSAALLASIPAGSSAFDPVTPGLVAFVLLANAAVLARRRTERAQLPD